MFQGTASPPLHWVITNVGRGYDWSHAGYKYGKAWPSPPITYDITTFGAVANSGADASGAIEVRARGGWAGGRAWDV